MDQKTNAVVSELHDEIYGLRCDIGRLEQENAKLRKLVDYMTPIAWYAASEQERDHMYELGIEVGE